MWRQADVRSKMKVELYNEILKEIKSFSGAGRKCGKYLKDKFPRYYLNILQPSLYVYDCVYFSRM
jgi:hypothetical protein